MADTPVLMERSDAEAHDLVAPESMVEHGGEEYPDSACGQAAPALWDAEKPTFRTPSVAGIAALTGPEEIVPGWVLASQP